MGKPIKTKTKGRAKVRRIKKKPPIGLGHYLRDKYDEHRHKIDSLQDSNKELKEMIVELKLKLENK